MLTCEQKDNNSLQELGKRRDGVSAMLQELKEKMEDEELDLTNNRQSIRLRELQQFLKSASGKSSDTQETQQATRLDNDTVVAPIINNEQEVNEQQLNARPLKDILVQVQKQYKTLVALQKQQQQQYNSYGGSSSSTSRFGNNNNMGNNMTVNYVRGK